MRDGASGAPRSEGVNRRGLLRMAAASAGLAALGGTVLTACGGGGDAPNIARELPLGVAPGCNATTWPLTAGAGNLTCGEVNTSGTNVGSVTVSSDATNIYVTYTLTYQNPSCIDGIVDAEFGNLHVWIGNDLLLLPGNEGNPQCPAGKPIPGQFCGAATGQCFDATGLTEYTFTYAIADLELAGYNFCGQQLYVVTHADVKYKDCSGVLTGTGDTAFGGDQCANCNRWWFYGVFTPNCTECPGGGEPTCDTAYAKGGWVWTTDKKSNPDNLPSLKLTKNRWGWAINLTAIGTTTYDIWAGAGLNKTSSGVKVGTLTVNWDGSNATVTYALAAAGYTLAEVHIYAGDAAPTTIAPGQYGFIDSFDPGVPTYTATLPLANTNGTGGVWVVAHAIVCHVV